jgi:hypothetical protein
MEARVWLSRLASLTGFAGDRTSIAARPLVLSPVVQASEAMTLASVIHAPVEHESVVAPPLADSVLVGSTSPVAASAIPTAEAIGAESLAAPSVEPHDISRIASPGAGPSSRGAALLSPSSEAARSVESTYSTDRYLPQVSRRGKYIARLPLSDLQMPDGSMFTQHDVKLRPIQVRKVDAAGAVSYSLGLGIALVSNPLGVVISQVTQPELPSKESNDLLNAPVDRGVLVNDVIIAVNCESVEGKVCVHACCLPCLPSEAPHFLCFLIVVRA